MLACQVVFGRLSERLAEYLPGEGISAVHPASAPRNPRTPARAREPAW